MKLDLSSGKWINPPSRYNLTPDSLKLETEGGTDFWQRSYYGFRNDNAPALLFDSKDNFSFTVDCRFKYKNMFDQCGLIIYLDSGNWFKASVEYENGRFSRLGSVVTNNGYSDWATTDVATPSSMTYRLHRRGPDFLIEHAGDGQDFRQMRIFHIHALGETNAAMGKCDPPLPPEKPLSFGLYACSPLESGFIAEFGNVRLEDCLWKSHEAS